MESRFYELIEAVAEAQSAAALGPLLTSARERFDGYRLGYLERLISVRAAEVGRAAPRAKG